MIRLPGPPPFKIWTPHLGVRLAVALLACAITNSPAAADPTIPAWLAHSRIPDLSTVADSACGAAIVTCVTGSTVETPAVFHVERRLGGSVPDAFTADQLRGLRTTGGGWAGHGNEFHSGDRFALLLRTPPTLDSCEFCREFHWQRSVDFVIWDFMHVRVPGRSDLSDSVAAAIYSEAWAFRRLTQAERVSLLAKWLGSTGWFRAWAQATIERHPEFIASGPLREIVSERLHEGAARDRQWAAYQLARSPDSLTRREFVSLAAGDSLGPELAMILETYDSTLWVRRSTLSIVDRALQGEENAPLRRWGGVPLQFFIETVGPAPNEAERSMLLRIAKASSPLAPNRIHALKLLASDTAQAVRRLVLESALAQDTTTLRGRVVERTYAGDTRLSDARACLSHEELQRWLSDSSAYLRRIAFNEADRRGDPLVKDLRPLLSHDWHGMREDIYQAAIRRRDPIVVDSILTWLHSDTTASGHPLTPRGAANLIADLATMKGRDAVPELLTWGHIQNRTVRRQLIEVLGSLRDPRAGPLMRRMAGELEASRDTIDMELLPSNLAAVGDTSDIELLVRWAKEYPSTRHADVEAIGLLAGIPRMIEVVREIESLPLSPREEQEYVYLGAQVREALARQTSTNGSAEAKHAH